MILFDYIYFRTYSLYKNKWNEEDPKLYAVGIVSLVQEFNLGAMLFILINFFEINIERIYVFLFYIVLFLINMLWYSKHSTYSSLYNKWNVEAITIKRTKGIFVLLYILISIILFFGSAIFAGLMSL